MTLAIIFIALSALAMYYGFDYLPECERRQGALDLLTNSIGVCFDETAPGTHLGIGEEMWCSHNCSETDDLNTLCLDALRWAQAVGDRYTAPQRLHWCVRPTYHVCNDHGTRKTCLVLRFFLRRIPEDPHA